MKICNSLLYHYINIFWAFRIHICQPMVSKHNELVIVHVRFSTGVTVPSTSLHFSLSSSPNWCFMLSWLSVSLAGASGKRNKTDTFVQSWLLTCLLLVSVNPFLPIRPLAWYFLSHLCLSGWIVSLAALSKNKAVGVIMMINAVLFTAQAAMGVMLLKRVNHINNSIHWQSN